MRLIRGLPGRRSSSRGQSLVEFALVFPIFLTMVMGLFEFAFVFNALLSIGHATRDAALVAAEAGNAARRDCAILQQVEDDVTAPADAPRIAEVRDLPVRPERRRPRRAGEHLHSRRLDDLHAAGQLGLTVPYTATSVDYPDDDALQHRLGTGRWLRRGHTLDTDRREDHLQPLVGDAALRTSWRSVGPGRPRSQSNAMRMEPVL